MTPEELRTYWNFLREPKQQALLEMSKTDPVTAFNDLLKLAALNFIIESYLETFKPQG